VDRWCGKVGQVDDPLRAREKEPTLLWEKQLVDNNVVRVDLVRRQLLDQPFGLVQGQELGDADANKGGLVLEARGNGPFSGGNRAV
jgi:hypothetical protein